MKADFKIGSSRVDHYWDWINERCLIYHKRQRGIAFPWTGDPIMRQYRFTNAFRQLDNGTIWLHKMLANISDPKHIMWTIIWYRCFNWWKHAKWFTPKPALDFRELNQYIRQVVRYGEKIFTSCHMVHGHKGELKHDTYLRTVKEAWEQRDDYYHDIEGETMQSAFETLLNLYCVGKFTAYEMVCDLRFTDILSPTDSRTWGNVGPGAKRGMLRLGLDPTISNMRKLLAMAPARLSSIAKKLAIFELREVEHCLCEFDKYTRALMGQGRPKELYHVKS